MTQPRFSIPISGTAITQRKVTSLPISGAKLCSQPRAIAISGRRRAIVDPGAGTYVVVVLPDRDEPYVQDFSDRDGLLLFLRDEIRRSTVFVFRGWLCEIKQQPDTARYYLKDERGLLHELGPQFDEESLQPVRGPASVVT